MNFVSSTAAGSPTPVFAPYMVGKSCRRHYRRSLIPTTLQSDAPLPDDIISCLRVFYFWQYFIQF